MSSILIVSPTTKPVPLTRISTEVTPDPSTVTKKLCPVPSDPATGKPVTVYTPSVLDVFVRVPEHVVSY